MSSIKFVNVLLLILPLHLCGQVGTHANWTHSAPFEQHVFIENTEGQFDGELDPARGKLFFKACVDGLALYFTSSGLVYKYEEFQTGGAGKKDQTRTGPEGDLEDRPKSICHFFSSTWKGANQGVVVSAEREAPFYYTYLAAGNQTIKARAFEKLIYKNLYKGIDLEYFFPENKKGVEYTLVIHPGANLADVKLLYKEGKSISLDTTGNLIVQSAFGEFTDHAPAKTWLQENNTSVPCAFVLHGNEVAFEAGGYDKTRTLIIDPWTTNPNFKTYDVAFEVRGDLNGNVYAYGNARPGTYQLVKLNSQGLVQWYFTTPFQIGFGDMTLNPNTGNIYVSGSASPGPLTIFYQITPAGKVVNTLSSAAGDYEIWRLEYDRCRDQIIIGGGGTSSFNIWQGGTVSPGLGPINRVNFLNTSYYAHDICLMALDEANGYAYMATSETTSSVPDASSYSNVVAKCPLPQLSPTVYVVPDGFTFREVSSVRYVGQSQPGYTNGFNGMTVSPLWLYIYDGANLKQMDKNNGAILKTLGIAQYPFNTGGLSSDLCGNVYMGNVGEIDIYDPNLNKTGTLYTPFGQTVFDVRWTPQALLACGSGFISSFSLPSTSFSIQQINSSACSGCNGTALVNASGCNTSGVHFSWSTGDTTAYISGLCAGTYSVTVSYGCVNLFTDTLHINSRITPPVKDSVSFINNVSCFDGSDGSSLLKAYGGTAPYSYEWIPGGQTGAQLSNVTAGTYTVIIQDKNGCGAINKITLSQPGPLLAAMSPGVSVLPGQSTVLTVAGSGGIPLYVYSWQTAETNSSITVAPKVTTTYTVLVTDAQGCTTNGLVVVEVLCGELFVPTVFSPNGDGQNDQLFVYGNCIKSMSFTIYDRWGAKVFETDDIQSGWDGTSKGQPANSGTFVYVLKAFLYDGSKQEKKGSVLLVR